MTRDKAMSDKASVMRKGVQLGNEYGVPKRWGGVGTRLKRILTYMFRALSL